MNIAEIDRNVVQSQIEEPDIAFYNALSEPFDISGLSKEKLKQGIYRRFPDELYEKVNISLQSLSNFVSGAMLRFKTNSPYVAIKVELSNMAYFTFMADSGQTGFDLYEGDGANRKYKKNFIANSGTPRDTYEGIYKSDNTDTKAYTLNFPLYSGIKNLYIGLKKGCEILAPDAFTIEKSILFYGSSITMGGCCSRPSNSYNNVLARWLDANIINFGFAGSCKGELEIADYINTLDLSAVVYDYDHNSPSIEHYESTHEPFFKRLREAKPNLPIIIITKPDFERDPVNSPLRREIAYRTYSRALSRGDKNVYFIDGETLFMDKDRDICTVDGCHPNDLGFMRMAEVIYPVLKEALKI